MLKTKPVQEARISSVGSRRGACRYCRVRFGTDAYQTVNEDQKQLFENDPKAYLAYRKEVESELNSRFKFVSDSGA